MKRFNLRSIFLIFGVFMYALPMHGQEKEILVDQILINNMASPWGMDFINDNELLFTEKGGKLKRYNIQTNTATEITGLPSIAQKGQGGLLDVALHPDFASNNLVYITYAVWATGGQTTAIGRGTLVGSNFENFTELFRALPIVDSDQHFGSRIAFDDEGFLYFSVGDRGTPANAQNLNNHAGKIMRLKDDGSVPSDNPFVGETNKRPEIYSYGHRNIQGMAKKPKNGKIYAHEHGPRGGDELNLVEKGNNYGWPTVTFGINYNGTIISSDTTREGMELPLTYWVPSIAPSGLVFINNEVENEFEVLIGALAGTHVHWLKMANNKKQASSRSLQGYARFRDIAQAPNGKLYALTESPNRLVSLKYGGTTQIENQSFDAQDKLYPNPSSENAFVKLNMQQSENVNIKILSAEGKVIQNVINKILVAGSHTISLDATLPNGMYWVEITKGKNRNLLKWLKL